MRIIGRRAELQELTRVERSRKSELVCVYGRRRVGKTFLVEQTFRGCFAFRATGVEGGNTRQQLRSFNQRLREQGDTIRTIPKDWFEAFSRLANVLSQDGVHRSAHGKRIVFLDEFPWFATPRSDFLMAFGEFWNSCGTIDGDLVVIICGSATSWIIGNIIENTGSLYDRVTSQIHLEPFSLRVTEEFFADREFAWSRKQIAECYMVFGGLPYFLELLDGDDSLRQNIDRLCLSPHALLRGESKKLLEATLKKSPIYDQVLALLAKRRYGMRRQACFEELGLARGSFERAVKELVRCGYVREYKDPSKKRNPTYLQLVDPFLLFHYRFLLDNHPEVLSWGDFSQEAGSVANWRGAAFEVLCLGHTLQIKQALGIAGVKTTEYPWTSEKTIGGAQVDLVIERADGITNLCEMKFTDAPFSIDANYEVRLLDKMAVYAKEAQTKQPIRLVLVSASGMADAAHTEHISRVVTLDDLFA